MKKLLLLSLLLIVNCYYSQLSSANEFVEFAKRDFVAKKNILVKSGWNLVKTKKDNAGEVSLYKVNIRNEAVFNLALRKVNISKNKIIYDTELKFSYANVVMLDDWLGELKYSGYNFTFTKPDELTYSGKSWKIVITIRSNDEESVAKINVIMIK